MYKVTVQVKEVRGNCALGYKPGDTFTIEKFYIKDTGKGVCLHALAAMLTLLAPLLKGAPATALGIGKEEDTGVRAVPRPRRAVHAQRNRNIRVEKGESGGRLELQPGSHDVHDPHRSPTVAEGGPLGQPHPAAQQPLQLRQHLNRDRAKPRSLPAKAGNLALQASAEAAN